MGDSILNGIVKEKLFGQGRLIKVKRFPGSTVDDLSHYTIPIIRKKPINMIIHIRQTTLSVQLIQDNLLKLKSLVNEKLHQWKVWLSTPTLRTDNGKASLTVYQLMNYLLNLDIDVIDNRNIKSRYLRRKGVYLNDSGPKLLAKKMKIFWVDERCSSIIKDNEFGYLSKDDRYDNPSGKTSHEENTLKR